MCGIAGEWSFSNPVNSENVRQMTDAIAHRGPDNEGIYCEGKIGLGHRRLSIIDLSQSGNQPMWTEDKSMCIVYNGEVYNYKEIRPELEAKGYRFRSTSDTEVILNAIHCLGMDAALQRFIGMFAFALWQARDKMLWLVRDRVGVKPLYYYKGSDGILFSSEMKGLYAHPSFRRDLSPRGLEQFFCFGYTLNDTTVYKNTFKLPAAHYLRIDEQGSTTVRRYWDLNSIERNSFRGSFEEAAEAATEIFDSAFRYRLVSDVPVGVFLSGGIDSSLLAAFLKKRQGVDLEHFTIGFEDDIYNEAPKAAQVARDLGIRQTTRIIDLSDARSALYRFVEIWDEPFGDTSGIPTAILCEFAREHVKVAMSADGGDELFLGYESYAAYDRRFKRLQKFPQSVRQTLAAVLKGLPYKHLLSLGQAFRPEKRWNPQLIARFEKALELLCANDPTALVRVMNEKGWTVGSVSQLLNTSERELLSETVFASTPSSSENGYLMDHMLRTAFSAFLGEDILTKVDRTSMSVSLECRDPFLDHRLAEFAFSLPISYSYHDGVHKRILKKLIDPWISPEVLAAPKRGFSIPLYDWMRGPWKPLVQEVLSPDRVRATGILNEMVVESEIKNFYRFPGGRAEKIMLMLNFQMWVERWHDL